MKNILFFESLITPKILLLFYWLSLISLILGCCFTMYASGGFSFLHLITLIFGCIGIRVAFELIMIAFKNNEYLRRIAERQEN